MAAASAMSTTAAVAASARARATAARTFTATAARTSTAAGRGVTRPLLHNRRADVDRLAAARKIGRRAGLRVLEVPPPTVRIRARAARRRRRSRAAISVQRLAKTAPAMCRLRGTCCAASCVTTRLRIGTNRPPHFPAGRPRYAIRRHRPLKFHARTNSLLPSCSSSSATVAVSRAAAARMKRDRRAAPACGWRN